MVCSSTLHPRLHLPLRDDKIAERFGIGDGGCDAAACGSVGGVHCNSLDPLSADSQLESAAGVRDGDPPTGGSTGGDLTRGDHFYTGAFLYNADDYFGGMCQGGVLSTAGFRHVIG